MVRKNSKMVMVVGGMLQKFELSYACDVGCCLRVGGGLQKVPWCLLAERIRQVATVTALHGG